MLVFKGLEQAEILELGVTYLSICMTLSFGIFSQFLFERLLQATGRTFLTMITQGIGAVINIILDPFFIYDYGLGLGMAGAAWATTISVTISLVVITFWFFITSSMVGIITSRAGSCCCNKSF